VLPDPGALVQALHSMMSPATGWRNCSRTRGAARRSSSSSGLQTWAERSRWRRQRRRAVSGSRSTPGASAPAGCAGGGAGFTRFAFLCLFFLRCTFYLAGSGVSNLTDQGGQDRTLLVHSLERASGTRACQVLGRQETKNALVV